MDLPQLYRSKIGVLTKQFAQGSFGFTRAQNDLLGLNFKKLYFNWCLNQKNLVLWVRWTDWEGITGDHRG